MSLGLKESQAVNDLADVLYDFLPGEPHPLANQAISFAGIAKSLGLASAWPGGSKRPAIAILLTNVLERRPQQVAQLMIEVTKRAMVYRSKKGNPLAREDLEAVNEVLLDLGYKIPELNDPVFLSRLPSTKPTTQTAADVPTADLHAQLLSLEPMAPQPRGYAFQRFLHALFDAYDLAPKTAFRLQGEEIDGSFQVDGDTYLLEATWRGTRVGEEELNAFAGKVVGKAEWSRGLHISYAGYTPDGLFAFSRGKPTKIICMEGLDLSDVLRRRLSLVEVIKRKARRAAETNEAFVPVRELFPE